MATSLLALIDDIATVLDDVAVLTKVAAKKTTGVLGDDLALNAQQVTGIHAERELPVVWAVGKGSLRNKAILVPAALAISLLAPFLITPLLMLGGAFLCFEGFEKLVHKFLHSAEEDAHHEDLVRALSAPDVDLVAYEKDKIAGAVRTDFILSAEIITITLGTVSDAPLTTQVAVLSGVAVLMTVGVYGLVAAIVKMDDAGLYLHRLPGTAMSTRALQTLGRGLLNAAPWLMKALTVAGTAAMFMVGGGILLHGIPGTHELVHALDEAVSRGPLGWVVSGLIPLVVDLIGGVIAGALTLATVSLFQKAKQALKPGT
ncbi:MAG TPA: DUF808 domain-containing protein [Aquabacterium sp.]|nr:DUF808 domain-containing protein [Aquabacterium sp.]